MAVRKDLEVAVRRLRRHVEGHRLGSVTSATTSLGPIPVNAKRYVQTCLHPVYELTSRSQVSPEDLNLAGFSHLNFAFASFDPKSFQITPMDSNSASLYGRTTALKNKWSGLEVWISVGGWSFTDPGPTQEAFSNMVRICVQLLSALWTDRFEYR